MGLFKTNPFGLIKKLRRTMNTKANNQRLESNNQKTPEQHALQGFQYQGFQYIAKPAPYRRLRPVQHQ